MDDNADRITPLAAGQGYNALVIDDLLTLMKSMAFRIHLACDAGKVQEVHTLFTRLEALHHALRKKTIAEANAAFKGTGTTS